MLVTMAFTLTSREAQEIKSEKRIATKSSDITLTSFVLTELRSTTANYKGFDHHHGTNILELFDTLVHDPIIARYL
jgi:hypothetical protein